MRLVKLVRDRIADVAIGTRITYRDVSSREHVVELRKKLGEEVLEYITDPSVSELADVLEVCRALAAVDLRVPWGEVETARASKLAQRGGFTGGVGMYASK